MSSIRIPFVKSDRLAFFIVFAAGFTLCTGVGMGHAVRRGWLHPLSVLGYLLGAAALGLGASVLLRRPFGPVREPRSALLALLGLILVKIVVGALY